MLKQLDLGKDPGNRTLGGIAVLTRDVVGKYLGAKFGLRRSNLF